ncbi:MAG: hypothetical protein LLF96_02750 [Eubacteriales bacterium]|nr:hypothetical protein [Eubacteriales bacterium]
MLKNLEISINPRELVRNLSISSAQTIEIAKAISCNAKIVIMDEPTSSLTENEVAHLFKVDSPYAGQGNGRHLYFSQNGGNFSHLR